MNQSALTGDDEHDGAGSDEGGEEQQALVEHGNDKGKTAAERMHNLSRVQ